MSGEEKERRGGRGRKGTTRGSHSWSPLESTLVFEGGGSEEFGVERGDVVRV